MNLNWLDIVIIITVAASVAEGVAKGFARIGIGLAGAIMGVVLGIWFYGTAAYYLEPYLSSRSLANLLGFAIIFVLSVVAGGLIGDGLGKLFKWAGLNWIDRVLGAVFGFARGLIGAIVLVLVLVAFTPKPPPRSVVRSHWAPYLVGAANVLAELAPRELRDSFFDSYNQIKELWNQALPQKKLRLPETEI